MKNEGYERILKSSAITGGAQIIVMLAGFFRMKAAAVFIGPAGVGTLALFNQSIAFISALSSLGLNFSGTREVAVAEGSGDLEKLSTVIRSLRILVIATGLLGAFICIALSSQLSRWAFGDTSQENTFVFLGIVLFLTEISTGQSALLRGLGKIKELALQSIVTALASSMLAIACYWTWGLKGILPSLIASATIVLIGSWWYARKVKTAHTTLTARDVFQEGVNLLPMGFSFVWCAVVGSSVTLLIGTSIRETLGISGNGYYQAAFAMSGIGVSFILGAMGQDFFPRLSSVIQDKAAAAQLINEQTEVGILLSTGCVAGMITFSDLLITLFYAPEFAPAAAAMPWFLIGCYCRIAAYPLSYVLIAKGAPIKHAAISTTFELIYLALSLLGLKTYGLPGLAAGFLVFNAAYLIALIFITRREIKFTHSKQSGLLMISGFLVLFLAVLSGKVVGTALTALCMLISTRELTKRLGNDHRLARLIKKITPSWMLK